jgi:hypothetical protein
MTAITDWITSIASAVSALGVGFAVWQLQLTKQINQKNFEDGLAKEYRELASRIPTKALLGSGLSPKEYAQAFDELFRYIDLSNEQILLRKNSRISDETWESWCSGIQYNLALPVFCRAWTEIKDKNPSQFRELDQLIREKFLNDPKSWTKGDIR